MLSIRRQKEIFLSLNNYTVTTGEDPIRTISIGDKISMKYLGTLDNPVAKMVTDGAKRGEVILIEISPKFFSTWDYSKAQL